jgi:phosphoribosylformimino-5-aminoimidazole carboxamide ribotide isomerase
MYLLVIPSIDIQGGKTVRVVQGIPELNVPEYGNDPAEMAAIWRAENAKLIHIVDFDGFKAQSDQNLSIISEICSSVIIPFEYSGGVRSFEDAKRIFACGIARIAFSTIIIENPKEFERIFEEYGPKKVVVVLDVIDNEVVTRARKYKTGYTPIELAVRMRDMGIERFIVTDVMRNGTMQGPNLELSKSVALATGCKVTHSGGIRNKDELMDLQALIPIGIDSVIIGRALYENRFPCQKLWRLAESGIFN